jgi:hypothetical protein
MSITTFDCYINRLKRKLTMIVFVLWTVVVAVGYLRTLACHGGMICLPWL